MKRLFSVLVFSLLVSMTFAQNNLFTAIGSSDVATLSSKFGSDVEICIGTEQDFYSKSSATKRLEKFFAEVHPKTSKFKHKGNNKNKTSEYSVGTMTSEKGNYRVFIYYEGEKITGLMFNKDE
ncbi:DUF4783 domain-containing protein [Portibacter lacus]|uniref:DUF4783 domain-containing protein n=1 Tax=Portibacter lacus TaxID=1099794 RepID=A0AA37WEM5_9BACT|nr:DUF4783 domain-containing protein [Portibacter lacus]GLR18956.1 hypothetical protein GCM10007940_35720 [Portibacter lacus]